MILPPRGHLAVCETFFITTTGVSWGGHYLPGLSEILLSILQKHKTGVHPHWVIWPQTSIVTIARNPGSETSTLTLTTLSLWSRLLFYLFLITQYSVFSPLPFSLYFLLGISSMPRTSTTTSLLLTLSFVGLVPTALLTLQHCIAWFPFTSF